MSNDYLSDEDKTLFRQVTKSVKPLKSNKTIPRVPPLRPQTLRRKPEAFPKNTFSQTMPDLHLSNFYSDEVSAQSLLSFSRHSIPRKRFIELRKGCIVWESKLDLHGLRQDEAQQALIHYILGQIKAHHRCLLIIHGKGSQHGEAPILKNLVNHWLKQIPQVLAFHSALPRDGGAGALYVLLKRNRDSQDGLD